MTNLFLSSKKTHFSSSPFASFASPFASSTSSNHFSSFTTIDKNDFVNNHLRKLIISTFSISNQKDPVLYASISGLPDNTNIKRLAADRADVSWDSVIIISKNKNVYSNLFAKDLALIWNNPKVLIFNVSLLELISIITDKNQNIEIAKEIINSGVFVFDGFNFSEIIAAFKEKNIDLSGGLGTKKTYNITYSV